MSGVKRPWEQERYHTGKHLVVLSGTEAYTARAACNDNTLCSIDLVKQDIMADSFDAAFVHFRRVVNVVNLRFDSAGCHKQSLLALLFGKKSSNAKRECLQCCSKSSFRNHTCRCGRWFYKAVRQLFASASNRTALSCPGPNASRSRRPNDIGLEDES